MSLIELQRIGLDVPDGFCLSASACSTFLEENGIIPRIHEVFENRDSGDRDANAARLSVIREAILAGKMPSDIDDELRTTLSHRFSAVSYAVRSSGSKEDMADASFAGLYTSVLGVNTHDELVGAIKRCFASLFNERVFTYCAHKGIDFRELSLAVILQEMVDARRSGVCFTVDPISGRDTEMRVEACEGLGDALVGGGLTPDSYVYDWFTRGTRIASLAPPPPSQGASNAPRPILSELELDSLCGKCLQIQKSYGFPVDVEWVEKDGHFLFVQARPITTIRQGGIKGQWTTADFKDGGVSSTVCTPLMWSLYDLIWEEAMPSYLRRAKVLDGDNGVVWGDMFYGRPYWNAGAVKEGSRRVPGFVEREFDEDLGIQVGYEGKGTVTGFTPQTILRGARIILALNTSFKERMRYNAVFVPQAQKRIEELDAVDPDTMTDSELFCLYGELINVDYRNSESSYFTHIFDNSMVQTFFKELLKGYEGKVNPLNLIVGLRDLSHLRPNYDLWDISRDIRRDEAAFRYWNATDEEALKRELASSGGAHGLEQMRAHVARYKYHSTHELDITVPNFGEDPGFVIGTLKQLILLEDRHDPRKQNDRQFALYEAERKKLMSLTGRLRRKKVSRNLERMRSFLWWREELRDLSSQMYHQIRRFTLVVGNRLAHNAQLESQDDIFFLPVDRTLALTRGQVSLVEAQEEVARRRDYFQSFRNYQNPPDIGFEVHETPKSNGSRRHAGIPCSPGCVEGTAKVIVDVEDARRLRDGDVLVTRFTDPGWTPVFGMISGVVTETGGTLSHAAVIAREYGIPAVLAVAGITSSLKDGQRIRVDGDSGEVVVLDDQP